MVSSIISTSWGVVIGVFECPAVGSSFPISPLVEETTLRNKIIFYLLFTSFSRYNQVTIGKTIFTTWTIFKILILFFFLYKYILKTTRFNLNYYIKFLNCKKNIARERDREIDKERERKRERKVLGINLYRNM